MLDPVAQRRSTDRDLDETQAQKKPQPLTQLGLDIGGAGGSRTPVRKHSAVGTTCLVPSLALATTVQDGHHTEQRAHYWFSDPV